jgi:hypothetical protein
MAVVRCGGRHTTAMVSSSFAADTFMMAAKLRRT